jgi:hypothetical protein
MRGLCLRDVILSCDGCAKAARPQPNSMKNMIGGVVRWGFVGLGLRLGMGRCMKQATHTLQKPAPEHSKQHDMAITTATIRTIGARAENKTVPNPDIDLDNDDGINKTTSTTRTPIVSYDPRPIHQPKPILPRGRTSTPSFVGKQINGGATAAASLRARGWGALGIIDSKIPQCSARLHYTKNQRGFAQNLCEFTI